MDAFRQWLQAEREEVNQRIEKGKGTWPHEDYVKDEDWARLMATKHTLENVVYMLNKLTPPSQ